MSRNEARDGLVIFLRWLDYFPTHPDRDFVQSEIDRAKAADSTLYNDAVAQYRCEGAISPTWGF